VHCPSVEPLPLGIGVARRGAARLVQLCRMEDFSETGNNKLWRNVTHADRPFDPVRQCRGSSAAVPL
jgi:hypothetical protein